MNIILKSCSILVPIVVMTSAAFSADVTGQRKVDDTWIEGQVRWTEGPPSYKYMWIAWPADGTVMFCGVGKWVSGNLRSQTREVIKDRGFFIGDTLYYNDITFFADVSASAKLIGAQANCVSTGKSPPRQVKDGVSIRSTNPNRVYR